MRVMLPLTGNRSRFIGSGPLLALLFVFAPTALVCQDNVGYQIEGSFNATATTLTAAVTLSHFKRAGDDGSLRLDLPFRNDITVRSVSGPGGLPLSYERSSDQALLTIDVAGTTGDAEVTVTYSISLEPDPEPFGYHLFSDPTGSRWYPRVVNRDGESERFSDFVVTLDLPEGLAVLTSGGYGDRETDAGRVKARYVTERVQDFAVVVGSGFVLTQHLEGAVPLFAFYHPDYSQQFATVAARTAEALEWYTETYGFFPVSFMGIVQGHPRWGGGFPMSNMFMVHLGNLDENFLAFITAHELGHYYWGLHVLGDREYLDWLALANGIWADQLYLSQRSGRTLEEQWRSIGNGDWVRDLMSAMVSNREQRLDLTTQDEDAAGLDFDYNSLIRHGKGATGVFLQSRLVGFESFLELQRRILDRYRHRPLPVDSFVVLLDSLGPGDTPAFFAAWRRGDARIDAAVDAIEPLEEGGGFRVTVRRTGTVPYPIEYEVDLEGGEMVRRTLAADAEADTVQTSLRPMVVRFDPNGVIPMPGSSHPGIRSLWLTALYNQNLDETFVPLAQTHLVSFPEDHAVRYRLARRLYWLGRWEESAALWTSGVGCSNPDQCRAGIYAARSLGKLGLFSEAKAILAMIEDGASEQGVQSFWETVSGEVSEGGRP